MLWHASGSIDVFKTEILLRSCLYKAWLLCGLAT